MCSIVFSSLSCLTVEQKVNVYTKTAHIDRYINANLLYTVNVMVSTNIHRLKYNVKCKLRILICKTAPLLG